MAAAAAVAASAEAAMTTAGSTVSIGPSNSSSKTVELLEVTPGLPGRRGLETEVISRVGGLLS